MKVLFLSMDRGLLGDAVGGGVVKRHLFYIPNISQQTIIVYSPDKYKFQDKIWHERLSIRSTGGKNSLSAFINMHKIGKRILSREKYDLIATQDPFLTGLVGYKLKKKFNLPLLIDLHGDFFENPEFVKESFINRFLLILAKFLIKKADLIRPVSQKIKDKLIRFGIKPEKIKVAPTPVDLSHFKTFDQEKLKELKRKYEGQLVLLFVGILKIEKNLDFFLRVLSQIKTDYQSLKFLIIGDGPKKQEWRNLAKKLKLEETVEFLGSRKHQDLPIYYNLADIFVLPSTSESLGKVIMEAAMAKNAVLASKTLGAQSLINHNQTGLLFEINDQKDCLDNLLKLIKNEDLRLSLGNELFEEINKKYDYQKGLLAVLDCWQTAINHRLNADE